MWIAKFRLKDDKDIFSPLSTKYKVDFLATPYTHFRKSNKMHFVLGGLLIGSQKKKSKWIQELRKDKRVSRIEMSKDFLIIHAIHQITSAYLKEIAIFYNPQYLLVRPVHVSSDGWEYWEVACPDRKEISKITAAAQKQYHGKLYSIKEEKLKGVSTIAISPHLTDKQLEALQIAVREGYYNYPRKLTIPELAKSKKVSYSTFQEHLRKAESKVIDYFFAYR